MIPKRKAASGREASVFPSELRLNTDVSRIGLIRSRTTSCLPARTSLDVSQRLVPAFWTETWSFFQSISNTAKGSHNSDLHWSNSKRLSVRPGIVVISTSLFPWTKHKNRVLKIINPYPPAQDWTDLGILKLRANKELTLLLYICFVFEARGSQVLPSPCCESPFLK